MATFDLGNFPGLASCGCTDCPCSGGCPAGTHCQTHDGETFVCTPDCTTDADCGAGAYCSGGSCYPNNCFGHDYFCPPPKKCSSGTCVNCTSDADCPSGYTCDSGECVPPTGGGCDPPCTAGEICSGCESPDCTPCDDDSFNAALGTSAGDPAYNAGWDFDCNGNVDLLDFAVYYSPGNCG